MGQYVQLMNLDFYSWIWSREVSKASLGEECWAAFFRRNWAGKNGSKESSQEAARGLLLKEETGPL